MTENITAEQRSTAVNTADQPVRIYVGAHQSEALPYRVLEYSIRRHASLPTAIRTIDNSLAPKPQDKRFLPYTHFSYGRFAIPKLAGYQGRAIYLDSDMLVFRDIAELWQTPFEGAKILVEKVTREGIDKNRLTAVMLLDCAALRWEPEPIIAGLGVDYDYDQLMTLRPLLGDNDLQDRLAPGWNSLDEMTPETRLLHYTKIKTQPWVYPCHPLGHYWLDEVRRMLADGALTPEFIRAEVAAGHVRPSLLPELGLVPGPKPDHPQQLLKFDRRAGYVIHRQLFEAMAQRRQAARERERELDPDGFLRRRRARRWRNFIRHPIGFVLDAKLRQ